MSPRRQLWTDTTVLLIAALAVVLTIVADHMRIDYSGMGLNVMLVATAYLVLITLLGAGWRVRFMRARRTSPSMTVSEKDRKPDGEEECNACQPRRPPNAGRNTSRWRARPSK